MSKRTFISVFTPSRTNPEVLEAIFVQRHKLLAHAEERLRDSIATGNRHHLLFIGPRGSGKTHFVTMLFHRLDQDPTLQDKLRIAWLGEDESTPSFFKFLLRIQRALQGRYPKEFPSDTSVPFHELAEKERETFLIRQLVKQLAQRTLLVIVENLNDVFKGLGRAGQMAWRAFTQEHPISSTLATSQQLFEGVSDRDEPFYGFFQIEHLEHLNLEDATTLLAKIADWNQDTELTSFLQTPKGRCRIRALHHLSGGSHRVYIVLSEFVTKEDLDDLVPAFEKMLDELTPYYQERVKDLPAQQREIVEYLCRCQQTVSVKQIAQDLYITEQTLSGQLKKLKEIGYVTSASSGRESRYELTEPLMRLSFEVKENRREPMRLIVQFLRIWYGDKLQDRYKKLPAEATIERVYVQRALQEIEAQLPDPVLEVLEEARHKAECDGDKTSLLQVLEEFAEVRGTVDDWFAYAYQLQLNGQTEKCFGAYEKVLQIQSDYVNAWYNKGVALANLKRYEEAIQAYDQALIIQPDYVDAWYNKGVTLADLKRYEEAIQAYDQALAIQPDYVDAWYNKGIALSKLRRYEEAIQAYDQALTLQPDYVNAWYNKGNILYRLGKMAEATYALEKSRKLDPSYPNTYFSLVLVSFAYQQWEEGFHQLQNSLQQFSQEDIQRAFAAAESIRLIFRSSTDQRIWKERIHRLVKLCDEANLLHYLGTELVGSLEGLTENLISKEILPVWNDVWQEVGEAYPDLELSLRIFAVGIRYLHSQDSRVLLDLLQEERKILADALGLETGNEK